MRLIRQICTFAGTDAAMLSRAMDSGFSDFEDAVQYFSALAADVDQIVTRNTRHFPQDGPPILTPDEFLRLNAGPGP